MENVLTENFSIELKEFEENTWAIYSNNNDQLFAKYRPGEGIAFCNDCYCIPIDELKELLNALQTL